MLMAIVPALRGDAAIVQQIRHECSILLIFTHTHTSNHITYGTVINDACSLHGTQKIPAGIAYV